MKPRPYEWLWPLSLALSIFLLSGTSSPAIPDVQLNISKDKIGHFFVFGLLATAILRMQPFRKLGWLGTIYAILLTSSFGAFDEYRQSFTPGRQVELADWIADTLGAIVATQVYIFWPFYRSVLENKIWERKTHKATASEKATP